MHVRHVARRLVLVFGLLAPGCAALTAPPEAELAPSQGGERPTTPPPSPSPPPPSPPPSPQGPQDERAGASHILVAYKGAERAAPTITRTKDEAKKRALEVAQKAKSGDFAALAKEYSDDPGSGPRGGALGVFTRNAMVKPFADAAFALKPGEVSGIVETEFGFHVIKRTQ
jgi:peptidyl-prolyl cis-trans isomerase NIMA-interacting 1